MSRIVIVSGPPGAGKSTVARGLAESASGPLAMHIHTDDHYAYIRKGFVAPWRPESQVQNKVLMDAMATSTAIYAKGGYEVFVDGIIGPWFFEPWVAAARQNAIDLHYVALLPSEDEAVDRAVARTAADAMTDAAVVRQMWQAFETFAPSPRHVVDTTDQTPAQTMVEVSNRLQAGDFVLS